LNPDLESELTRHSLNKPALLSIGIFDGVHIGHQQLVGRLLSESKRRNLHSIVVTFWPHPLAVLDPQKAPPQLDTLEERVGRLKAMGVETVVVLPFTKDLAGIDAVAFVKLLQQKLKMQGLIIGPDFALGKRRQGDVQALQDLGNDLGFTVEVIPPVVLAGTVVSSTAIRTALAIGDVREAARLLGRPFDLSAEVVSGDHRGRELGFPTANLAYAFEQALPADGIYATIAVTLDRRWPSVTNIGVRPTFGGGNRLVEVFIMGYSGQLYGQHLQVEFIERIRQEKRFAGAVELKAQMLKDVEQAKSILHEIDL
jgi:riboflavin kinase/FMN adenylyltransferase